MINSKNVIVILCDSMSYDKNIFDYMPNLKKYKDNIIEFNNYFSQAPYTEAALVPVFSASNVTDYEGYFNNLKNKPKNINEIFKTLGYKTYNTLWFYPNTLSFLRGVDEYDYVDTYSITYYLTSYRIMYFRQLFKNGSLKNNHIDMIQSLLDDFFEFIKIFIDDYENNKHRFDLLIKYTEFDSFDFEKFKVDAKEHYIKYISNKKDYIYELLKDNNDFYNEDRFNIKYSQEFKQNESKLNKFILKVVAKQLYHTIKNGSQNQCFSTLKYTLKNLKNKNTTFNSLNTWLKFTINYPGKHKYKMLSGKVIIDRVSDYLISNKEHKNFVLCHLMDTHYPFNFISSELDQAENEINSLINSNYKVQNYGNNFYKFSVKYIDEQIGNLIKRLESEGLMNDTSIIITSDHGSSYLGNIYRNVIVNTFFEENYKIPMFILNKNIIGQANNNLGNSKQLIPTVLDFLGFNSEEWIRKESILSNNKDYIIFEYFGAGCPDYIEKPRLFCIKNDRYKIQYRFVNDIEGEIIAVYDLFKDEKELMNIKDEILNNTEIQELLSNLKQRIENIK